MQTLCPASGLTVRYKFYKLIILLLHKKQAEYYFLFRTPVLYVFGSCSYNCLNKQYIDFSLLAI